MKKQQIFKGIISFNVKSNHPDLEYIKNPEEKLNFEDTYTLETHYTEEEIVSFIKGDLSLVAGGGYSKDTICNVEFDIKRVG